MMILDLLYSKCFVFKMFLLKKLRLKLCKSVFLFKNFFIKLSYFYSKNKFFEIRNTNYDLFSLL